MAHWQIKLCITVLFRQMRLSLSLLSHCLILLFRYSDVERSIVTFILQHMTDSTFSSGHMRREILNLYISYINNRWQSIIIATQVVY